MTRQINAFLWVDIIVNPDNINNINYEKRKGQ